MIDVIKYNTHAKRDSKIDARSSIQYLEALDENTRLFDDDNSKLQELQELKSLAEICVSQCEIKFYFSPELIKME